MRRLTLDLFLEELMETGHPQPHACADGIGKAGTPLAAPSGCASSAFLAGGGGVNGERTRRCDAGGGTMRTAERCGRQHDADGGAMRTAARRGRRGRRGRRSHADGGTMRTARCWRRTARTEGVEGVEERAIA